MTERLHYTDSGGRPIILNYLVAGLIERLQHYYLPVLAYVAEVSDMEGGLRAQEQSSAQLGRRITSFSVILDTKGVTLAHRELLYFLNPVLWTDDHIFLRTCTNSSSPTPRCVSILWQVVQVFIDKQTRAKFVFLPVNRDEDIKRLIGAKETPHEFGGGCDPMWWTVRATTDGLD